jgi:hypothetical protein
VSERERERKRERERTDGDDREEGRVTQTILSPLLSLPSSLSPSTYPPFFTTGAAMNRGSRLFLARERATGKRQKRGVALFTAAPVVKKGGYDETNVVLMSFASLSACLCKASLSLSVLGSLLSA